MYIHGITDKFYYRDFYRPVYDISSLEQKIRSPRYSATLLDVQHHTQYILDIPWLMKLVKVPAEDQLNELSDSKKTEMG